MFYRFRDEVAFFTVYVREAHPTDGWRSPFNDVVGIKEAQPKTFAERTAVANRCQQSLDIAGPMLIDLIDDKVCRAYSGFPDRLYIIDLKGKVAYKSGRGPFGYKPHEMEQALILMLLEQAQSDSE